MSVNADHFTIGSSAKSYILFVSPYVLSFMLYNNLVFVSSLELADN